MTTDVEATRRSRPTPSAVVRSPAEENRQPVSKSFTVRRLDQVKVLTDPLRQRILGAFMVEPRTTKQIASRLGEKPSRLYHHVDALARAGLLELKETRQNRGTIEKYFQSVATHFMVDSSLFPSLPDRMTRVLEELNEVFDATRAGFVASMATTAPDTDEGLKPLLARVEVRGSADQIRECRRKLLGVLKECQRVGDGAESDKEPQLNCGISVFFTLGGQEQAGTR